ncbi:MAG: N-acetylglucosamine kinase [Chloroflexota bacterium]
MRYVVGGDLGGTKSHLLIADETGRAVGFAEGGGANHEAVGYGVVTDVVRELFREALRVAGRGADRISGGGFGIAGLDWRSEEPAQRMALYAAGLRDFPVAVVNDAVVGLLAGSAEGWGVGLVSGTGCNCWGIDRHRRYGRVLGMGARVGEFAGGAALVARAIWAVSRAATRRGPATALTDAFLSLTGRADAEAFLEDICEERIVVGSSSAPLVFDVARAGDPVAVECIGWAGRELGDLVLGVTRQLDLADETFDLVLIGSLFKGGALLIDPLLATVHAEAPGARPVPLTGPPVVGGVVLALGEAGSDVRSIHDRLLLTTSELLHRRATAPTATTALEVHS